jgi:hypothetical protein
MRKEQYIPRECIEVNRKNVHDESALVADLIAVVGRAEDGDELSAVLDLISFFLHFVGADHQLCEAVKYEYRWREMEGKAAVECDRDKSGSETEKTCPDRCRAGSVP